MIMYIKYQYVDGDRVNWFYEYQEGCSRTFTDICLRCDGFRAEGINAYVIDLDDNILY